MAAPAPFDLQAVGKLFNDILSIIRDDTPDIDALEPQALQWLKKARYKLMRDIEKAYYQLARSRHAPLLQPRWAADPTQSLFLMTGILPTVLQPFQSAIGNNLRALLEACGFDHTSGPTYADRIYFYIRFPRRLTTGTAPRSKPRTLLVEDEFTVLERAAGDDKRDTGTFMGSDFGRLLIDARGESATGESSSDSGGCQQREFRMANEVSVVARDAR